MHWARSAIAATALLTINSVAYACRLTAADCQIVAQKMRYLDTFEARERARLGALSPFQRKLTAARRRSAEEARLAKSMPPKLGNEMLRLINCELRDYGAALDGRSFSDPSCR